MVGVYEATAHGRDVRSGAKTSKTYTIDIGRWGREPDAEKRVRHKAKRRAYSDGIRDISISVSPK